MKDYIVSARKYRPMKFEDVIGQKALTTTLKNSVKSGKLAHAYLFCGPRGVGKTTCARIFAKAINCQYPTNNGEACNECESCISFNEGRSFNIFELDAASNNSVENIKQLMEQTRIPPQDGKYKVFIIDEVHMLSPSAFNAFLKTLEEPPAHVIFILATTEKQKILPTILSRCQIYDFERISVSDIVGYLKKVAEEERITYEESALNVIAEKADGGMRDALSIFDQATSFTQGNLTYEKVIENLNVLDAENYFKMIDLSLGNDVADILLLLNKVLLKGFDGGQLINGYASHIRNLLMAKDAKTVALLEISEKQKRKYVEQARKCPTKFLYRALKILNRCDVNYKMSSNKRLLVELTLIEVAQAVGENSDEDGAGQPANRIKPLFSQSAGNTGGKAEVRSTVTPNTKESPGKTWQNVGNEAENPGICVSEPASESPANRQKLKLDNLGLTFSSLKKQSEEKSFNPAVVKQVADENRKFTDDDLQTQWIAMCNRMPHELIGLSSRMKNIRPRITEFPNIELIIENEILLKQIQEKKETIANQLSARLHNGLIRIDLRIAKPEEVSKIFTKKEMYEELKTNNTSFNKLHELLDLEMV